MNMLLQSLQTSVMNSKLPDSPLEAITCSLPSFQFRFLDLPVDLRFQIYKLASAGYPRTVRLIRDSTNCFTSLVQPASANSALLYVSRQISSEAATALYQGKTFQASEVETMDRFLGSFSEGSRFLVKHIRLSQATLPCQELEFYTKRLRELYTIERIISQEHVGVIKREEKIAAQFIRTVGSGIFKMSTHHLEDGEEGSMEIQALAEAHTS